MTWVSLQIHQAVSECGGSKLCWHQKINIVQNKQHGQLSQNSAHMGVVGIISLGIALTAVHSLDGLHQETQDWLGSLPCKTM